MALLRPLARPPRLPRLPARRPTSSTASLKPHASPAHKAYAHTLLLPTPSLPLTPPDAASQRERFAHRTGPGLYRWQRERTDAEPHASDFVFLDGPPYANGDLHIGHAMNKILKDIINRYQVLQGRRVDYRPGWDCHGLPIESKAVRRLSAAQGQKDAAASDFTRFSPSEIREAAGKVAAESVAGQRETFELLGIMADWASPSGTYRTLDGSYVAAQLAVFARMVENGLVYSGYRPTYYSPSSRTALAEAELKYREDHRSASCWVRLKVAEGELGQLKEVMKEAGVEEEIGLLVWTTTAWTMGSNTAVMVNPSLSYTLARSPTHGLVVLATDLLPSVSSALSDGELTPIGEPFEGSRLLETRYDAPLASSSPSSPTSRPVIPAKHVTSQSGSGLVHCAPAHGLDDYLAFASLFPPSSSATSSSAADEPFPSPIDDAGNFTSVVHSSLTGLPALGEGSEKMIGLLGEAGVLCKVQEVVHKYPYDWKTDEPVLVRATRQWFANLDGVKERALSALKDVTFVPPSSRTRLESFVRSRSEWCISRQRTWGVPIPALYSRATGQPHLTPESLAHVVRVLEEEGRGVEGWWELPVERFVSPGMGELEGGEGKDGWRKGEDTMDVWFDSGSAWSLLPPRSGNAAAAGEAKARADVVLEGSDQHRGWFQSLLLTYLSAAPPPSSSETDAAPDQAPYKAVVTHGMVLDLDRRKMSKSEGNILAPADVLDGSAFRGEVAKDGGGGGKKKKGKNAQKTHYGPDTLRVWAASSDYTSDCSIGKAAIDDASNVLFSVRRLLRFLSGSIGEETKAVTEWAREDLTLADKYVLHLLAEYEALVRQAYETFAFHPVMKETVTLLNHLSAFYIDMTRDSVYSDLPDLPARQVVLSIFQAVLDSVAQAVAPIAPFMSEELAEHRTDVALPADSVFSRRWQTPLPAWHDPAAKADMQVLLDARTHVAALLAQARDDKHATTGRMSHLELQLDTSDAARVLEENRAILTNLFGVSHVTIVATPIDEPQPWSYTSSMPTSSASDTAEPGIQLRIYPSALHKCPRCWDFTSPKEDRLCVRCETVVRAREDAASG